MPATVDPAISPVPAVLAAGLATDYPDYCVWTETFRAVPRYGAAARTLAIHPHTVITTDPSELRAALGSRPPPLSPEGPQGSCPVPRRPRRPC